jgi:phosphoglycolate phosphatase
LRAPLSDASRFSAILFDLDGTLVETRRDIATGINLALADRGLPGLSVDRVARHVGRGARFLVTRCLEESGVGSPSPEEIDSAYHSFHAHYLAHLLETTVVYPGIPGMCDRIMRAGVPMAVVTNKPIEPTKRILTGLGLSAYFPVVLGGDSLPQRKPDPAPLLRALSLLGAEARRAVMVGDSEVDVEAARAAGVTIAAVTWGFVARQALESASPDLLADSATALTDWILA